MNIKPLIRWFQSNKRELPWRKNKTPYKVWISEVMLQQTTAVAVIPYFEKWMKRFPNIKALAEADLSDVIKQWEGLGYYSRARRLHSAAQKLVDQYQASLPSTYEELKNIEGLGPYTIGAILSFAFEKKAPAIDGNVIRVVTRLERISEDVSKAHTKKTIHNFLEQHLPEKDSHIAMEAFIELGAVICKKKPSCGLCPVRLSCKAYEHKDMEKYPVKPKRKAQVHLKRIVTIITFQDWILVKKELNKTKVMADLYEFPYFEKDSKSPDIFKYFKKPLIFSKELDSVIHHFTHHKVHLSPKWYKACERPDIEGYLWYEKSQLFNLPFSSGHKKILLNL